MLDHLSPFRLDLHVGIRISVSRQIDQIHLVIDVVKIDGLCLARLRRSTRKRLPVHKRIDQGGLADIGLACKSDLRARIVRKRACDAAHRLQIHTFYLHRNTSTV